MDLVILPVHIMSKPVAKGSNVPACPIFLDFSSYFTFFTAWKDDHPKGLSIKITRAGYGVMFDTLIL